MKEGRALGGDLLSLLFNRRLALIIVSDKSFGCKTNRGRGRIPPLNEVVGGGLGMSDEVPC